MKPVSLPRPSANASDKSTPAPAPTQGPTLTVTITPGAPDNSGLSFPNGGGIGPAPDDGRGWFYNVLLTGTLPAGTDASSYGIKQSFKDTITGTTADGKKYKSPSSDTETVAPHGRWAAANGNGVYAVDSPGPANVYKGKFVDSVTTKH